MTAVEVDLSTPEGPARLVERAIADHGRVDILVNNMGGVRLRLDGFLATTDKDFEWAMNMNFFAALRATRAAITQMVKQGGGHIVNVASVNAFFQPDGGTIDYGAAKAALVNLAKSLSQEFGPRGIRINSVSPGPVSTDLWLGENGVAQTVGKAMGVDAATAREQGGRRHRRVRDRTVHHAGGGRRAGRHARLRANGQRHGRELRDRRRSHQDAVNRRRDLGRPPRRYAARPSASPRVRASSIAADSASASASTKASMSAGSLWRVIVNRIPGWFIGTAGKTLGQT